MAQAPLTLQVLEHLRKKKFLTAMWFVENYRHLTYWQQMAPGYEFWFVFQQGACMDAFRQAGCAAGQFSSNGGRPRSALPLALSDEERRTFGADLSFVGAGYANRRQLFPALLRQPWSFKLWGNEWDGAGDLRSVLQLDGARIDTATCMKVFNATAINLNLHSTTGAGLDPQADFVNPRTFELAACGAFQLVDHRSQLPPSFSVNRRWCHSKTLATFRGWFNIGWQTPRLGRPWRMPLVRVLNAHTYVHRMRDCWERSGCLSRTASDP